MGQDTYVRWDTSADISLTLNLINANGTGATGKVPQLQIRRWRDTHGGYLDNFYWNGTSFTASSTWLNMTEVDAGQNPGVYHYLFTQSTLGSEHTYSVYYRHLADPAGFAHEYHIVTNELFKPQAATAPIITGTGTVMGQLSDIKDGGAGTFDVTRDNLHSMRQRVAGLLHENVMLDKQVYDAGNRLLRARLRLFDQASHVPIVPDANETTGLVGEYQLTTQYDALGRPKGFSLTLVQ
jgi:hypothetical protein